MFDVNQLMQAAQNMRERLSQAQSQAAEVEATGEAGGGMVKATVNGKQEVIAIKIEPACVVASEVALLEDLVRAAVNQAHSKVAEGLKNKMQSFAKDMGVDAAALGAMGLGPTPNTTP